MKNRRCIPTHYCFPVRSVCSVENENLNLFVKFLHKKKNEKMNLAYCAKVLVTFEFVLKVLNKNLCLVFTSRCL